MIKSWKDLEVWKKAHELSLKIYELTNYFPNNERYRLVDQLCRSAVSVPTNIVEGKSRKTRKEYLQFLFIAKGSIEETKYLLLLSKDLAYVSGNTYYRFKEEYDLASKMLNGLIRSLRNNSAQNPTPKT